MGDISTNFSLHEFRSRDGHAGINKANLHQLVARLEALRCIVGGKPMRIVSGHRSVEHNRAVGGASDSQHIYSRAADLEPGYATVAQAEEAGFTGIGERDGWAVHVDTRARPARWSY